MSAEIVVHVHTETAWTEPSTSQSSPLSLPPKIVRYLPDTTPLASFGPSAVADPRAPETSLGAIDVGRTQTT